MEHPLFLVPAALPLRLLPDETVEDLQNRGMRLLQRRTGFRFGTDSVLLAAYAASLYASPTRKKQFSDLQSEQKEPDSDQHPLRKQLAAIDLGAGCGAASMLLAARLDQLLICGLEVDRPSCETLARNIALNRLHARVAAMNIDIRRIAEGEWPFADAHDGLFAGRTRGSFDLVIANPPYQRPEQSFGFALSSGQSADHTRTESSLELEQLLQAANRLLRPGGRLVMVHRAHRLADILPALRACRLEPRTLRLVQPLPGRRPSIFLLSAIKNGRPGGFQVEAPLIVVDRPGQLSAETASWYGHEPLMTRDALYQDLMPADGSFDTRPDEWTDVLANSSSGIAADERISALTGNLPGIQRESTRKRGSSI